MKKYEIILEKLKNAAIADNELATLLLIDTSLWEDFKKQHGKEILLSTKKLKTIVSFVSKEYLYFINNYYCPVLGKFDLYLPYVNDSYTDSNIFYNFQKTKQEFPTLLPIGNIDQGDYIFLNEKGEVIQFVGIGREEASPDFFTEVSKDEYDIGWDIAYLTYPDADGLYRMYMVLAFSFDEFMNECVFGDKYPEFTEKKDWFYKYIKKIRKDMNV
jgi:hypothetical protein